MSRYLSIFVTCSYLCIEYVKEQKVLLPYCILFTWNICHQWMVTLYRHHNQKSIPEKNQLSMLEFQTAIANDLRSAGKLASASRPSWGRPSFTTTVKAPLKKHRTPTVPDPSNNTRFDKLDHFPVFQEKQQRCRKRRTCWFAAENAEHAEQAKQVPTTILL